MPSCKWYDAQAGGRCPFTSNRQYNLDRHERDIHEDKDNWNHRSFSRTFFTHQSPDANNIFNHPGAAAIVHKFPKSSLHTILIPTLSRDPQAPKDEYKLDAFQDPVFLAHVREEASKLHQLAASELRRKFGSASAQDRPREAILNGEVELAEGEDLPNGRDWMKDVLVGVHASSFIDHLHVHVISKDLVSDHIKCQAHYNSFATEFFIGLDELPLTKAQTSRRQKAIYSALKCWRCGKDFGTDMGALKTHLAEELDEWKRE